MFNDKFSCGVPKATTTIPTKRNDGNENEPPSVVLPAEAVDRLRAAAGTIILASPEFQRLMKDVGATVIADPPVGSAGAATH